MVDKYKCLIFVIYSLTFSQAYGQQCKGGAECIRLPACDGLYTQLQQNYLSNQLKVLLRSLHCGFENRQPMICCPPEFRYQLGDNSGVTEDSRFGGQQTSPSPQSLLPDSSVCGLGSGSDRIVGGVQAGLDEHPWMVLLRYDKRVGWGFYCGGVLISSRYVMTAAHCVKGQDLPTEWRLSQVRLGEWNTATDIDCVEDDCNNTPVDVKIEEIIAHEEYGLSTDQHNDIALLRLAKNVEFTDFIKPICLPLSEELRNNKFDGYQLDVAGWGKTESRSESNVKLKVKVPVVTRRACNTTYSRIGRQIINKQLCAGGNKGEDSCRGDSGGALMGAIPPTNSWYAVGVVSFGPTPCGTLGWPGVYTRVGAYVDWILSKLRP